MNNCWIQVTSWQGPDECAFAVYKITDIIIKEVKEFGLKANLIEAISGNEPNTYVSSLISIKGNNIDNFISRWKGTVQWICYSPFRPNHRRKNWFIGVDVLTPNNATNSEFNLNDIVFQTMRASGAGGQHVNTTDSAVRATHTPTGITVVAKEERSQHMNKKLAIARITKQLSEQNQSAIEAKTQDRWRKHKQGKRGNPVRVFVGEKFREK